MLWCLDTMYYEVRVLGLCDCMAVWNSACSVFWYYGLINVCIRNMMMCVYCVTSVSGIMLLPWYGLTVLLYSCVVALCYYVISVYWIRLDVISVC